MLIDEEYETPYNDLHTRAFLIKCRHQSKMFPRTRKKVSSKKVTILCSYDETIRCICSLELDNYILEVGGKFLC